MITIRCNKDCAYTIKASALVFIKEEKETVSIRFEDGNTTMEDKDESFMIYEEN